MTVFSSTDEDNNKENHSIMQIMAITIRILNIKFMKVGYVLGEKKYW